MAYKAIFDLLQNSLSEESAEIHRRIRADNDIFALYKYVEEAALVMKVRSSVGSTIAVPDIVPQYQKQL